MATTEPTARSLDALAAARALVATFHAGHTVGGHHWTVADGAGVDLLRTKRAHSGGVVTRALWKSITLTGLDAGNDIHADVLGAGDAVLARASSLNKKPALVTVTAAGGPEVGRLRHEGDLLALEAGDPPRAIATVELEGDGPWPVVAADGTRLGELLAGAPGPSTSARWDELIFPVAPTNSGDFARTMHLGVRRVVQYTLLRDGEAGPAPPLVGLLPLLAGLAY